MWSGSPCARTATTVSNHPRLRADAGAGRRQGICQQSIVGRTVAIAECVTSETSNTRQPGTSDDVQTGGVGKSPKFPIARDRGMPPSRQDCAMRASPRRALRRLPSTKARRSPARRQNPSVISSSGRSANVVRTLPGSLGSLRSSVRTAGAISTCRSPRARSSSSTSRPAAPSRKAIQVLVSAAITRPSTRRWTGESHAAAEFAKPGVGSDAATSCRPVRTVSVIPAPLARCARASRSPECYGDLLHHVHMVENTILVASHRYGSPCRPRAAKARRATRAPC